MDPLKVISLHRTSSGMRLRSGVVQAARDQAVVAAGQVTAGLGNFLFSLLTARLLVPGAFSALASFLAIYILLSLPGSSLSAATSLAPDWGAWSRKLVGWAVGTVGVLLVTLSPILSPALRLPVGMIVVLGISTPALGFLPLWRGYLYASRGHRVLVASLVSEPAVRLTVGIVLAATTGAVGAAAGVVIGGYGALEVARRGIRSGLRPADFEPDPDAVLEGEPVAFGRGGANKKDMLHAAWAVAIAFLLLAVVQSQDLIIANRILPPRQAGGFAVLSTLGGVSAFATFTVPFVLLPRSARRGPSGLLPALAAVGLLGGGALLLAAAMPDALVSLFGPQYRAVASDIPLYMLAMAFLGVSRVLAAHACAIHIPRLSNAAIALAVLTQACLILTVGHNVRSVALCTLVATSEMVLMLTAILVAVSTIRRMSVTKHHRAAAHES